MRVDFGRMWPIYQDPTRPARERAADLLARMTLEEKLAQLHAFWLHLVLSHEECAGGPMAQGATRFPSALASGATWNPELVERGAAAIGREARGVGCRQGLAPVLDVSRDVRWGRTEETLGEDPYLVGLLGTRFVRGLQGERQVRRLGRDWRMESRPEVRR